MVTDGRIDLGGLRGRITDVVEEAGAVTLIVARDGGGRGLAVTVQEIRPPLTLVPRPAANDVRGGRP